MTPTYLIKMLVLHHIHCFGWDTDPFTPEIKNNILAIVRKKN